ncbi:MAG: OmpA family protein [Steroidobacteraceae bacterium]
MSNLSDSGDGAQEAHWIPLSDLMTGLMVMFLFIAVVYMMRVEADTDNIKEVAIAYSEVKDSLYEDLSTEFHDDLSKWKAEIVKDDLSIRFTEPEILFANGSSELKPSFQAILDNFFPRYVKILTSDKYRDSISEVRIEGHTSLMWENTGSSAEAYFYNMDLSQARTRSTLFYVLKLPAVAKDSVWLRKYVTANGLSSSHPVLGADGSEDAARSRRVEFRVRTDAETRIAKILQISK